MTRFSIKNKINLYKIIIINQIKQFQYKIYKISIIVMNLLFSTKKILEIKLKYKQKTFTPIKILVIKKRLKRNVRVKKELKDQNL